jgi:hypothetical protein
MTAPIAEKVFRALHREEAAVGKRTSDVEAG